jgi:hypothetical protein
VAIHSHADGIKVEVAAAQYQAVDHLQKLLEVFVVFERGHQHRQSARGGHRIVVAD